MTGLPDPLDFLAALTGASQPDLPPRTRLATIDPAYTVGTLPKVTFDGETTMSTKQYPVVDGYTPRRNARVLMVPSGHTYVIVGTVSSNAGTWPPRVKLYRTTNQTGIPTGTVGAVVFDAGSAAEFEQPPAAFHSTTVNPSRIVIPVGYDGLVSVKWAITYSAASGGQRSADLYKNGSFLSAGTNSWPTTVTAAAVGGANDIEVVAGDFLELAHYQASGGNLDLLAGPGLTFLSVIWRAPLG